MNHLYLKDLLHRKLSKLHLLAILFVAVIAVASLVGIESFNVPVANASSVNMAITGTAWSSNVGWISFSGQNYGVYENPTTGALSGYAWSYSSPDPTNPSQPSGLGWLQFGISDVNHTPAKVDFTQGSPTTGYKITGYARFISSESGSWGSPTMGWVSLSGNTTSGSSYGITQKPNCTWSGYAWEPTDAGWIQSSGTAQSGAGYGVKGNTSSVCSQTIKTTTTINITRTPRTLSKGQTSNQTWSTKNATSLTYACTGYGNKSGSSSLNGSQSLTWNAMYNTLGWQGPYQCIWTAKGPSGSVTASDNFTIQPPLSSAPSCTLLATPPIIQKGNSSTLTYTTSNSTAFSINNGVGMLLKPVAGGSRSVSPTVTTTYTGYASTGINATTCSAKVVVTAPPPPPPTGTLLSVYPNRVTEGKSTQLKFKWSLQNVKSKSDTCQLNKRSAGAPMSIGYHVNGGNMTLPSTLSSIVGTITVSDTINTRTRYYIDCNGKIISNSIVVNVVPTFNNF